MFDRSRVTRTQSTEEGYLQIYCGRVVSGAGCDILDFNAVAEYLQANKAEWMPSTWRRYKAACVYSIGHFAGIHGLAKEGRDATAKILATEGIAGGRSSGRTSSMRAKAFTRAEFLSVLDACNKSSSAYSKLLHNWLLLGAIFGLRPHEWGQCEINTDGGVRKLVVQNGKQTNGRAHGKSRTINIPASTNTSAIETLQEFIAKMQGFHQTGQYDHIYECCRKLLYRINCNTLRLRKSDGAGGKMRATIQIYSGRHSFASTAKLHNTKDAVAALLGHAVDSTAERHYGKRGRAVFMEIGVTPSPEEIRKVRRGRPSPFSPSEQHQDHAPKDNDRNG